MSYNDLKVIAAQLTKAASPEDIFGKLAGDKAAKADKVKVEFRRLIRIIHPDHYTVDAERQLAQTAFKKLVEVRGEADRKIEAGTYGNKSVPAPPSPSAAATAPRSITVVVRKRQYVVHQPALVSGDIADIYACSFSDKKEDTRAVFKLARSAGDNDLLENESKVLADLYPPTQKEEKYYRYLPRLLDSFMYSQKGGLNRRVNVFPHYADFFSLADVLQVYPEGLDYRDVVWMLKRILEGLGFVHQKGYIHGAIIPSNVLVHPVHHGAKIIDWSYAVPQKRDTIKAISKTYKGLYPSEVLRKEAPYPSTDIYMAVKTAILMLGGTADGRIPDTVPKALRGFFTASLASKPERRPSDAWALLDELVDILERVVGKPKYRPLAMPPSAKA